MAKKKSKGGRGNHAADQAIGHKDDHAQASGKPEDGKLVNADSQRHQPAAIQAPRKVRWVIKVSALLLLSIGTFAIFFLKKHSPTPEFSRITTGPAAGYVGPASCAECHAEISESYKQVAMGRSVYRPTETNIVEDYTSSPEFFHEPSRQYFRMTKEDDKFYQIRWQKGPGGKPVNELKSEVHYVMGSGNHARSYIHMEPDGKMYQLPVAWYPQESKWAMNPGYDNPVHSGFSRRITYDCAFCHAAVPQIPEGMDRFNYAETSMFPNGLTAIDCERCHGPGAEHVKFAQSSTDAGKIRKTIYNPARDTPEMQTDLCMQCHLETTSSKLPHAVFTAGSHVYSYRPGEPSSKFRIAFDHPEGVKDDKFEIAGQAYRMRKSRCFTESHGKMTCTTCHDPHRVPENRIEYQINNCMKCHTLESCTETQPKRAAVQDNCMTCHMPQRRTDDVIHAVMTDHFIQKNKPSRDLLAMHPESQEAYQGEIRLYYPDTLPQRESDLYYGIAYVTDGADTAKGTSLLSRYLSSGKNRTYEAPFVRGVGYKALEQYEAARQDIQEALKIMPESAQAHMALGDIYESLKNYTSAVREYETAVKLQPWVARAWNGLGANRYLLGNRQGALEAYRKAAAVDPYEADARFNLANVLQEAGDLQGAERASQEGLTLNPYDPQTWKTHSEILAGLNRPAEAVWYAAEAVRLRPTLGEYYDNLAALLDRCSPPEREKSVREITSVTPFEANILHAKLMVDRGQVSAAAEPLLAASSISTSNVIALNHGGRLAARIKQHALSGKFYGASLANFASDEEAISGWAIAGVKTGNAPAAIEFIESRLQQNPQQPRLINTFALVKAAGPDGVRDGAKAEALVNEAVKQMGGQQNVILMQTLAAALAEQGRFDEAVKTAEGALEIANKLQSAELVETINDQLEGYKAGLPYRLLE